MPCMTARTFVDSNILIYAHDLGAGVRHQYSADYLNRLWQYNTGRLSTQVLQEFYVNVTRKIRIPLPKSTARGVVLAYARWVQSLITPARVIRASEISEIWQISFWDGLILAAAEEAGASELLSEDLNHGQLVAGIRIVNPFVPPDRQFAN
jgi:predicted nucleic acid-binding protein